MSRIYICSLRWIWYQFVSEAVALISDREQQISRTLAADANIHELASVLPISMNDCICQSFCERQIDILHVANSMR